MDFGEVYCRIVDFWEVCSTIVDFQETEFPRQQAEVLFGKDFTVNQAFNLLDRDDNGQVMY